MAACASGSIMIIACLSKVAMDQSPVFGLAFILGWPRRSQPDVESTTGAGCTDLPLVTVQDALTMVYKVG